MVGLFPYWTLAAAILFALQLDHHNHNLRIAFAIIVGMRDAVVLLVWLWTNDISEAIELSQKNLGDTVTSETVGVVVARCCSCVLMVGTAFVVRLWFGFLVVQRTLTCLLL